MIDRRIRELFPGTRKLVYLNAASQALLPLPVVERVRVAAERQAERGITGYPEDMRAIAATREAAARRLGVAATDVALVANTAEGVAKVAESIDWRPGDAEEIDAAVARIRELAAGGAGRAGEGTGSPTR